MASELSPIVDRGVLHRALRVGDLARPATARGSPRSAARCAASTSPSRTTATPPPDAITVLAASAMSSGSRPNTTRLWVSWATVVATAPVQSPQPDEQRRVRGRVDAAVAVHRDLHEVTGGNVDDAVAHGHRRSRPSASSPRRRSRACGARRRARRVAGGSRRRPSGASCIVSSGGSLGPSTTSTSMRPPAATSRPPMNTSFDRDVFESSRARSTSACRPATTAPRSTRCSR